MTRIYCICVALIVAVLLALSASGGPIAHAHDSSPTVSTSGCGSVSSASTPLASPAAKAGAEPTLLTSPERMVWVGGPNAVVLLHQINLNMRSWIPQAEAINAAGYTVVAIENAGPRGLQLALSDLRDRCGAGTITVIAASIGGPTSETTIRDNPNAFDQIVFLSCQVDATAFGEMPKLFVASEGEAPTIEPAAQVAASAGDDNIAITYPGSAHAQEIFTTENGDDLLAQILDWLGAHP